MRAFNLINLEWNAWNGFIIELFHIEFAGEKKGFEGDLLGFHFSKDHLTVYLFFVQFDIKSPII